MVRFRIRVCVSVWVSFMIKLRLVLVLALKLGLWLFGSFRVKIMVTAPIRVKFKVMGRVSLGLGYCFSRG